MYLGCDVPGGLREDPLMRLTFFRTTLGSGFLPRPILLQGGCCTETDGEEYGGAGPGAPPPRGQLGGPSL